MILTHIQLCQGGKRTGIEPRVLKPKAPIHTVGSQLQRRLLDIPLMNGDRLEANQSFFVTSKYLQKLRLSCLPILHQALHLSTAMDQGGNQSW